MAEIIDFWHTPAEINVAGARFVNETLAQAGKTWDDVAEALCAGGEKAVTGEQLASQAERGVMSFARLLQCLDAVGIERLDLTKLDVPEV